MSDDLRAACEQAAKALVTQFTNERFKSGDGQRGILNTGRLEALIATALQQREAATWRKAATWARGIRAPLAEQLRFGEDMAKQFEANAQEGSP